MNKEILGNVVFHLSPEDGGRPLWVLSSPRSMRIVNAGKSKYYDAALDHLEQAKKCYAKAGLHADWQTVVDDVRRRHSRKKGFMAGFEDIVSGAPKHVARPFLNRAKARWPKKSEGRIRR